ncbi:MAG: hypothetical protein WDN50_20155 [Bradyrhizobium sp.]
MPSQFPHFRQARSQPSVSPGSTRTDRSQPIIVLAGIEDAQPTCRLKAFLFEPSVAFWATTIFLGQSAAKSGGRSRERKKHREIKNVAPRKNDLLFVTVFLDLQPCSTLA